MWTVDVGLGCLVVELLTSTVGVLGLIPGQAIVYLYANSSFSDAWHGYCINHVLMLEV